MSKKLLVCIGAIAVSSAALAITIDNDPIYTVDEGVAFTLSNSGASHYLFNWSDGSGTFSNVDDPTLILSVGETYTFQRTTSAHPFVITDNTLPVSGTDGAFNRTTLDGAVIDAATLTPIADFTADPAPTSDLISWTPTLGEIGTYYYTCRVTSHTGMTGSIQVVPEPGTVSLMGVGALGLILLRKRK